MGLGMGLLGAALRKRDAAADEPAPVQEKPADNKAFFKAGAKPTDAEKAKSNAARDRAIRKRDEQLDQYQRAWEEGDQPSK